MFNCKCIYKTTGLDIEPTEIVYLDFTCPRHSHLLDRDDMFSYDPKFGISIELLNILMSKPIGF